MIVSGRLVLEDRVEPGRIVVDGDRIAEVESDPAHASGPIVAPGFVDVHVHGWGGYDAMADEAALQGMARALLQHGVTSFLPTAVTAPLAGLAGFAERVRRWVPRAADDGAEPLGFNLEGPFLAFARRGAHDPEHLRVPAEVGTAVLEPLLDGLRVTTIAPELPGALELIRWLVERGVAVSLGHSAADVTLSRAGYAAGATTTTHLLNAMTGLEHRNPGLAVAALTSDDVFAELIADGQHVDPALWPLVARAKPVDRLLLVSDAVSLAGMGDGRARLGSVDVEVAGDRCTVAGTATLAGSVIALDRAVANLAGAGVPLPAAVAAAGANPAAMLGLTDRGRIAAGLRADLVELDDDLQVRRVLRAGRWHPGAGQKKRPARRAGLVIGS